MTGPYMFPVTPSSTPNARVPVSFLERANHQHDVVCADGSLWRWDRAKGWRLLAMLPGSAAAAGVVHNCAS